MSLELRPLGVACNLSCHYCYQNPQREAGNQRVVYDLEKMKASAARIGGRFTLFGGEPLLMPFADLEDLFAWGLEKNGGSTIQTNGALIEDRHIDLFRKYKVQVGISIDGPGNLNDVRWNHSIQKTREATARVEQAIEKLCHEYQPPGLIITLHKGNATAEKIPAMARWLKMLDEMGIRSVRLHLLEVDDEAVREHLALSAAENVSAMLAFAKLRLEMKRLRFDLFDEMERLLNYQDGQASCVWRACDPYTTEAVQGIEGQGQSSNCGRTNKDGVDFIKASSAGFERYVALYQTPQSEKGCSNCRFFLMCKGQCPGTAIDGDWRNRTEHCQEWKELFVILEKKMILEGKIPLTLQPIRLELEKRMLTAWTTGKNPSVGRTFSVLMQELNAAAATGIQGSPDSVPAASEIKAPTRVSWVSEKARDLWSGRLDNVRQMLEDMTIHSALAWPDKCSVRRVPVTSLPRLIELARIKGIATLTLPESALPGLVATDPGSESAIFLAGRPPCLAEVEMACKNEEFPQLLRLLHLPSASMDDLLEANPDRAVVAHYAALSSPGTTIRLPKDTAFHPLLANLGLTLLPIIPSRFDDPVAEQTCTNFLQLATREGYLAAVASFWECMSWSVSWSSYHGITEVKTPVFRLCHSSAIGPREVRIWKEGTSSTACGASGLAFPFAPPSRKTLKTTIELSPDPTYE